jgi:tetratricopeptide (TPR) repeat protein
MYEEDYIKRTIRQFTQLLSRLLGFQQEKNYPAALQLVDQAYQDLLGLSSGLAHYLVERDLLELLTVGGKLETEKAVILVQLLKAEGDLLAEQGNRREAITLYLKSLNLLLEVSNAIGVTFLKESFTNFQTVIEPLTLEDMPPETLASLFVFYDDLGEFAKAREVLIEYMETIDVREEGISQAVSFLQKLSTLSDEELASGNLTREEIEKDLQDFCGK